VPQPRAVAARLAARTLAVTSAQALVVGPPSKAVGFLGLTHYDQRNANNGNQFSIEPPSPEIAAAKGWILQGVNNAIQIYSAAGTPLLARPLSTNELFAVPPAIDRATDVNGVYPTDMRVFYDHLIDRWFILQRAQDYNTAGYPLPSSHLYIAVSQTGDPTGNYNIYTLNTTNPSHVGCPCFSDFPQIGADQYGIFISSDEYDVFGGNFVDVSILAISKTSIVSGSPAPRMQEFVVPRLTGYEGTVRPAITPPGASFVTAFGGVEFFVSTQASFITDSSFALWALMNTASLNTTPDLSLVQTIVPGQIYSYPDVATQKDAFLPYGSTLFPPGRLAFLDGGRDSRVLSLIYAGAKLYLTFGTQTVDGNGRSVIGGGYAVLTPAVRGGVPVGALWRQGTLVVNNHHVLRPAVAVNAQGRGAIAFTLVGPDHFPSAAFVPVDAFLPAGTLQRAAPGVAPEDGFTGYPDLGFSTTGVARWGDYSGAVVSPDGSVWMTMEYIPNAPRTDFANWGTHVVQLPR
jgi:hypothetical protein